MQSVNQKVLNKKVLIISYYYPPINDVGGQRALALSKYLPEYGWEPYVLSVKNPDKYWCTIGKDTPPEGVNVFYTMCLFNLSWVIGVGNALLKKILKLFGIHLKKYLVMDLFSFPDQFIGWIPLTFLKGFSIIKKHKIDVVIASCKPVSCGIIGYMLKVITKKPFLLDIRDPLSPTFGNAPNTYYKLLPSFRFIRKLEKRLLIKADKITIVTDSMKKEYIKSYPFLDGKMHLTYNGFTEDYFQINPLPFEKFTIVYVGNFYHYQMPPDPFFKALEGLIKEIKEFKNNFQFYYIGKVGDWQKAMIEKYHLDSVVKLVGHVDRQQSIEFIYKSSLFLIRVVKGAMGTKIFEGLAAGVPIILLTEEEEAKALLKKYSSNSYCVAPDNIGDIQSCIKDVYGKWLSKSLEKQRNEIFFNTFNRRNMVGECSKILNDLSK